jgi:hypothetical protein
MLEFFPLSTTIINVLATVVKITLIIFEIGVPGEQVALAAAKQYLAFCSSVNVGKCQRAISCLYHNAFFLLKRDILSSSYNQLIA